MILIAERSLTIPLGIATTLLPEQANNHCFPGSISSADSLEFSRVSAELSPWWGRVVEDTLVFNRVRKPQIGASILRCGRPPRNRTNSSYKVICSSPNVLGT